MLITPSGRGSRRTRLRFFSSSSIIRLMSFLCPTSNVFFRGRSICCLRCNLVLSSSFKEKSRKKCPQKHEKVGSSSQLSHSIAYAESTKGSRADANRAKNGVCFNFVMIFVPFTIGFKFIHNDCAIDIPSSRMGRAFYPIPLTCVLVH